MYTIYKWIIVRGIFLFIRKWEKTNYIIDGLFKLYDKYYDYNVDAVVWNHASLILNVKIILIE